MARSAAEIGVLGTICLCVALVASWGGPSNAATEIPAAEKIKSQASSILADMIQGISDGDYGLYARHFSATMKASQSREDFLQLQKSIQKALGKLRSIEYLGFYVQDECIIALFKARFTKEKGDVLIKLVLENKSVDPKVTGLWLDSPALEK